ncbi:efflux RND transporter periplasmic adaptor subunit [Pseudomonas sp. 3A(2025)]
MPRRRLISCAFLCTLPLLLAACSDKTPTDPRTEAPLVRVAVVQAATSVPRAFTGTVAARVQSDLGFRVAGKVLERRVDTGQTVRRGQVLMRIDPADLQLAARAQREAVAAARARAAVTAQDEARYHTLRASGAVSASTYDQARAAADAAKADLNAAQAQAQVAFNATGYAELLADADGTVMETLAEPGQVLSAGQVAVRVAHAGPREAVVQLPETLRPPVGSSAQATLFGNSGIRVPTRLRQLSDVADRQTRTFEARYVLEGELASAPLGTTITVQITGAVAETGLQVPIAALHDAGSGPGVWVIEGEPAKVRWQPVRVQQLDDESVHISGTLKPGERIVALGAHLLHEGEAVRLAVQTAVAGAQP